MEVVTNNYMPGDPRLVEQLVYELKSQGIFDQFRKECIADVDTKPAYQNLRQRVEGSVASFLKQQIWKPDMNKNQVREQLRKNIYESGYLDTGVERIVDQVVNPKINTIFLPQVEDVVYRYLGIEKPNRSDVKKELKIDVTDLLPTDLEAISPESDHTKDDSLNFHESLNSELKMEEDESPPFEPIDVSQSNISQEENSVDSHLSGFSGLQSHDSNPCMESKIQMELSNQDSQVSQNSSDSRLSIVTSEDNTKIELREDSNSKLLKSSDSNSQMEFCPPETQLTFDSNSIQKDDGLKSNDATELDIDNYSIDDKNLKRQENEKDVDKKIDKKQYEEKQGEDKKYNDKKSEDKKSRSSDKYSSKDKKEDKHRKSSSSTSRDKEKSSSKYISSSSKDKIKNKDKKDSKSSSSNKDKDRNDKDKDKSEKDINKNDKDKDKVKSEKEKDRSEKDRDRKERDKDKYDKEKDRSMKEKEKSVKDKEKNSSGSSSKYSSSKGKEKSSTKDSSKKDEKKSHSSSSSSSKENKPKSSHSDSKSKSSSSDKHKKDDKSTHNKHSSSSSSSKKDKDKKRDSKKDVKDDHYSSKDKKNDRRSTDRDSNDGKSSRQGQINVFVEGNSSQPQKNNHESSNSNSGSGSGDSGTSDQNEPIIKSPNKTIHHNLNIEVPVSCTDTQKFKYLKPKFASNFQEARKLMKIRKQLAKLERHNQLSLAQIEMPTEVPLVNGISCVEKESINTVIRDAKIENYEDLPEESKTPEINASEMPQKDNAPVIQSRELSKENWEALEARLAQEMSNINYNSYESPYDYDNSNHSSNATSPTKTSNVVQQNVIEVNEIVEESNQARENEIETAEDNTLDLKQVDEPAKSVEIETHRIEKTVKKECRNVNANVPVVTESNTDEKAEDNVEEQENYDKDLTEKQIVKSSMSDNVVAVQDIENTNVNRDDNKMDIDAVDKESNVENTRGSDRNGACIYLEPVSPQLEKNLQFLYRYIEKLEQDVKHSLKTFQNNFVPLKRKFRKRKLADNVDLKNNNKAHYEQTIEVKKRKSVAPNPNCVITKANKEKLCNSSDISPNDSFSLPLSPAESDKSNDKKEEESPKTKQKRETVGKSINVRSQRYSSEDLYKPRPIFPSSRRTRGAKNFEK